MSSRCFTWFPISGLGEPEIYQNLVCITRMWILLRVSDFEELVGINHRGMMEVNNIVTSINF